MRGVFTKVVVLLLACGLAIAFVFYNHDLVERLQERNRSSSETIAWFWAGTQVPFSIVLLQNRLAVCASCGTSQLTTRADSSPFRAFCEQCGRVTVWHVIDRWSDAERAILEEHTRELFSQLIARLDYTTVFSDRDNTPQILNGVSLPETMPGQELVKLRHLMQELDAENDPIPLLAVGRDTLGWLHYGGSSLEDEFRYVPYVEIGLLLSMALVLLLGVRGELRRERGMAWVSFAKETAHQLGTPLSSLIGWLELLRDRPDLAADAEAMEAFDSMEKDIERLQQLARRYGELGKKPSLEPGSVNDIVGYTVRYFESRPGLLGGNVSLQTNLNSTRVVMLNPVLMGWVMENMIKNSLTALKDTRYGLISISTRNTDEGERGVEIQVTDNGSGIPFNIQKKIFNAGVTTRRGGWGLGLTLSRRIIEEYHGGSMRLAVSSPEKGSTFVIHLPAYTGKESASDDDPVGR